MGKWAYSSMASPRRHGSRTSTSPLSAKIQNSMYSRCSQQMWVESNPTTSSSRKILTCLETLMSPSESSTRITPVELSKEGTPYVWKLLYRTRKLHQTGKGIAQYYRDQWFIRVQYSKGVIAPRPSQGCALHQGWGYKRVMQILPLWRDNI